MRNGHPWLAVPTLLPLCAHELTPVSFPLSSSLLLSSVMSVPHVCSRIWTLSWRWSPCSCIFSLSFSNVFPWMYKHAQVSSYFRKKTTPPQPSDTHQLSLYHSSFLTNQAPYRMGYTCRLYFLVIGSFFSLWHLRSLLHWYFVKKLSPHVRGKTWVSQEVWNHNVPLPHTTTHQRVAMPGLIPGFHISMSCLKALPSRGGSSLHQAHTSAGCNKEYGPS